MPALQRIIDVTLILFVGVLWGIFLVFGWASPLEGAPLTSNGILSAEAFDPAGSLHGQIRNVTGEPVAGVRIQLFRPGSEEPLQTTDSNDLGGYELQGLNAGLFILQADHPEFEQSRKVVMVEVDGRTTMNFTLAPASPLKNATR